jgi:hypothetical protein
MPLASPIAVVTLGAISLGAPVDPPDAVIQAGAAIGIGEKPAGSARGAAATSAAAISLSPLPVSVMMSAGLASVTSCARSGAGKSQRIGATVAPSRQAASAASTKASELGSWIETVAPCRTPRAAKACATPAERQERSRQLRTSPVASAIMSAVTSGC